MPNLTKSFVDTLSYTGRRETYRDDRLKGFLLRVSATRKTYAVETKVNGRTVLATIGPHGVFTAEQARKEAQPLLADMARGINPNAAKRAHKARGVTLQQAFKEFLAARKNLKPRTVADYRLAMSKAFPDWGNRALVDITKDMIERRHRELGKRSPARANLYMRFLRALFNFAAGRYEDAEGRSLVPENPVRRLSQARAWYCVKPRETMVQPEDMSAWWQAVEALSNRDAADYFKVLVLTGLRRSESLTLRWEAVTATTLTVPDTKNGKPHTLPLSDYLRELFDHRRKPEGPVFGALSNVRYALTAVRKQSVSFTLHDLRRTFATAAANKVKLPWITVKALLNHKVRDITGQYVVQDVDSLREPMQQVTDYLLRCAKVRSADVVTLRRTVD